MFGKRIIELRKENGMTQTDLANLIGISRSALSLYEIEKREPDIKILDKLASLFNVQVDYLIGRSDIRFPEEDLEWRYPHVNNRLGEILHNYYSQNSLSENNFAEQLDISLELLTQLESGTHNPSLKLLKKISDVTGYDIDFLTGAKDSTSKKKSESEINGIKTEGYSLEKDMHFKTLFGELCMKRGINNDNSLERLGLERNVYTDIKYNRMPTLSELVRISFGLGVSMDYLVGKTDIPIANISDEELELLLDYRDCTINSYRKNIRQRAKELSIECLNYSPSATTDGVLKKTGTTDLAN